MYKPEDIVTDAEIELVHANVNFGATPKRRVVDEALLSTAFGYSIGYTARSIIIEHGLVRQPRNLRSALALTVKGMKYLRALKGLTGINTLLDLMESARNGR